MTQDARAIRIWPYVTGILLGVIFGFTLFLYLGARNIDDRTREWVVRELANRFDSRVELKSLHVDLSPPMEVTGEGLTLYYHDRTDVPPLIHVEQFHFNLGVFGIIHAPRHINGAYVQNMTITIPPRQRETDASYSDTQSDRTLPHVIFDEIICNDTSLIILPKKQGKDPLEFDIHDLVMRSVDAHKRFDFHGNLTNAKPKGEIFTKGTFGPWDAEEPGDTHVSGTYDFSNADLGPLPGIGGILSSTGRYLGQLNRLEVEGQTDTPNFSLDPVGRPLPLHTDFSATVDGTDGDTYLHPVRAILLRSLIIANGSVIRSSSKSGHVIALEINAPKARLQDILRLATKSNEPVMSGEVSIKAKMLLPPGKQKIVDRLHLEGRFGVADAEFGSTEVREKLESLSRHALGKPNNEDAGSALTDLSGNFQLARSLAAFRNLDFNVPGAEIKLDGNYALRSEVLDFHGDLRMRARLSQTVTGPKSVFLKFVDPFFKKDGAGSVVPIRISGTRESPKFALALFKKSSEHKSPQP
jgi:AsmA-like C-terminal region